MSIDPKRPPPTTTQIINGLKLITRWYPNDSKEAFQNTSNLKSWGIALGISLVMAFLIGKSTKNFLLSLIIGAGSMGVVRPITYHFIEKWQNPPLSPGHRPTSPS